MYDFYFYLGVALAVLCIIIALVCAYLKSKAAKEKDAESLSIYSSAEHSFLVLFLLCFVMVSLIIEQELIIAGFLKIFNYLEALKGG